MTLNVTKINDAKILRGLHRIANRVTGLVLTALIIGAP